MQQQITEVINDVLAEQGLAHEPRARRVVEQVSARLAEALDEKVDALRVVARQQGISGDRVQSALVEAGLVVEEPEPEAADTNAEGSVEDRVATLESAVRSLTQIAERAASRFGF